MSPCLKTQHHRFWTMRSAHRWHQISGFVAAVGTVRGTSWAAQQWGECRGYQIFPCKLNQCCSASLERGGGHAPKRSHLSCILLFQARPPGYPSMFPNSRSPTSLYPLDQRIRISSRPRTRQELGAIDYRGLHLPKIIILLP